AIQKAIAAVSDLLTRNDSSSPAPEKAALQGSGQISPFQTSDQDRNYIIVQKTFSGITKEQIPADFQVTVSNSSVTYTLTQGGAANIEFTQSEDGLTWRWKILDATIGTYNVTESGMNIDRYTVATT
ncbi:MAG: hypothetical protein GX749_05390, partial [Ruminococcaceae bacterium]|nr:hypothetical protein [Oscillospiraceae bacterium]